MPHLDIGDWPTWIQAGTTTLALIAAAYAARQTHRTIRLELSRDVERREDELQREARYVSIWSEAVIVPQKGWNYLCHLYVRNANPAPVYNATLTLMHKSFDGDKLVFERDAETGLFTIPPMVGKTEYIVGTRTLDSMVRDEMDSTHNQYIDDALNRIAIELVFSDSAGRRWARSQHGELRRVDSDYRLPETDETHRGFGYSEQEIQEMGSPD